MKLTLRLALPALACLATGCSSISKSITHTPPGTSVELALAKKPELVKLPVPVPPAQPLATPGAVANVPAVEPPMPEKDLTTEKVAEAYSRGIFCLQAEREDEALASFEEVVKIDPTFTDAWEKIASIYEKRGDSKKALEAFKKAKKLARQ